MTGTTIEPFDAVDVIRAKRDGGVVPEKALRWMVDAYTRGYVADAQMASFAMAILLNGMQRDEIRVMTDAMIASGERMSFAGLGKRTAAGISDVGDARAQARTRHAGGARRNEGTRRAADREAHPGAGPRPAVRR